MKTSRLAIAAAVLATTAFGAFADEADGSQYGVQFNGTKTRAEVQAELGAYRKAGVNPWSISYNPLASFNGAKTRAQVQAEYLANRDTVQAMTREDSGSAFLAQRRGTAADPVFAGQRGAASAE